MDTTARSPLSRILLALSTIALQLGAAFPYLLATVIAPEGQLRAAWAVWGILATLAVYLIVRRSWWALAVPAATMLAGIAALVVGVKFLGWSG